MLVVACAESVEDVPAPLRRCFTHELALEAPDEVQRLVLLQVCMHALRICHVHACYGAAFITSPVRYLLTPDVGCAKVRSNMFGGPWPVLKFVLSVEPTAPGARRARWLMRVRMRRRCRALPHRPPGCCRATCAQSVLMPRPQLCTRCCPGKRRPVAETVQVPPGRACMLAVPRWKARWRLPASAPPQPLVPHRCGAWPHVAMM